MPPTPLDACSRQALEDHFRASQPGPDPRGLFEGRFLCWVDGPPPSMRLVDTLLFRALRFGVDFDRGVWWFVRPRVTVGRFRSSRGPSRWREAEVLRLEYDVSRLPPPLRTMLYDEVKPLTEDLCLGLGGVNAPNGRGAHFFFALARR